MNARFSPLLALSFGWLLIVVGAGAVEAQEITLSADAGTDFGSVAVGGSADLAFTITRNSGTVTVDDITLSGDTGQFSVDKTNLPATLNGGTTTFGFTVTCSPDALGSYSADIDIVTSSGGDTINGTPLTVTCDTGGEIGVTPDSLSFDQVAYDDNEVDTETFTISNSGEATLTIDALPITGMDAGSFTVVSWNPSDGPEITNIMFPQTIAVGESAVVTVEFLAAHTGSSTATLTVEHDDPNQADVPVALSATAADQLRIAKGGTEGARFDADATSHDFGTIPQGEETAAVRLWVCNDGTVDFDVTSVVLGNTTDFETVTGITDDTTVGPGNCLPYDVKFTPQANNGSFTTDVTFNTTAVGIMAKSVTLTGRVRSVAYEFVPDPVAFGDQDVDSGATSLPIQFCNRGNASLRITHGNVTISAGGGVFSENLGGSGPTELARDECLDIPLDANPSATGSNQGTLDVIYTPFVGGVDGAADTAQVALSVNGTSVNINLSANFIDFQTLDVDAPPAEQTVTVENTGVGGTMTITGFSILNNDEGVFQVVSPSTSDLDIDVSAGSSIDFVVSFDPNAEKSEGEPQATLQVTTSAGDIVIPLDGFGLDRLIQLPAGPVVFPDTYRNPAEPTVVPIEITNLGGAPLSLQMVNAVDEEEVFSVVGGATVVGPRSTEVVDVAFNPRLLKPEGYTGKLELYHDDDLNPGAGTPQMPRAEITLEGQAILPLIGVDPGEIDYGQVGVGVTSEVGLEVPVVDIVNLDTDRSFSLRELRVVDDAGQPVDPGLFRVRGLDEPRTVDAGGRIGLEVEFNPRQEGEFRFRLQVFAENDPLPVTTAPIRATAVDVKLRGGGCQASGGSGGTWALLLSLAALYWVRRRRTAAVMRSAGLVVLLVSLSAPALAQSTRNLDLSTFRPTLGAEADFMTVDNTRVGQHLAWTAGIGFGYVRAPLVVLSEETEMEDMPVESRLASDLYASLAFLDRFEVGAAIKLLRQSGTDPQFSSIEPADGFAVGDLALYAKMHILSAQPLSLAVAGFATAPTATDEEFAGAAGFSGGARAIAGVDLGRFRVGANLGYRVRENGRLADVVQGDEMMYSVGGSYLAMDELQVVGELVGALGIEGDETGGISPLEALIGVRYHIQPSWGLVAGVGRGLVSGIGAPEARGFLLLTVAPGRRDRRVVVSEPILVRSRNPMGDDDGDGIINRDDVCPGQAEDMDQFEDGDGCPDADNDGDGIPDGVDRCSKTAEDEDGHLDDDGCPDPDNDDDEIPDSVDQCPDEPEDKDGFQDEDGCDDFDNDRDGVADLMDACPKRQETINGVKDNDGCPDKGASAVMIMNNQLQVLEAVTFAKGSANLTKRSKNVLAQVAQVLRANPEFEQVAIEAHVHPRKGAAADRALSEKRAKVVEELLRNNGVAEDRMTVKPLGSTQPLRKDGRNAARFNDRIVIKVLKVADEKR